ncbi:MAG: alpha-L-fucosidase [Verrucomicrobia bacterium]|nr:MAG: alpha-L-fucosidase [Verrucomicrobiota bacterium]
MADSLERIEKIARSGPFQPEWNSLAGYQIPDWYQDAKFGIFIHWGVYAVPAYGSEWYPREMYNAENSLHGIFEHHRKTWGPVDKFGYKDFIPLFTARRFDPAAWARLFRRAGARYVIPVAEHHDGFPMYDSALTEWNAARMGPRRDLLAELAQAIRSEGLHFGLSNHRAENWWFFGGGRKIPSDVQDERYRGLYGPARDREESENGITPPDKAFLDDWLLRCAEQIDRFEPEIMWFDWWIAQPAFHEHLKLYAAYYYNRGVKWPNMVAINYKKFGGESFPDTAGVLDIERGQLADKRDLFWQTDTSVSKNSWGYVTNQQYKTVNSIIDDLVDIVSKNGSLLLNIGPRADGTIPEEEERMLLEIGDWLELNGEAIYETRPWKIFGEGPTHVVDGTFANDAETSRADFTPEDIRFTTRGSTLYATLLEWPGDGARIRIHSLTPENLDASIREVTMLGHPAPLDWEQSSEGLAVTLPERAPGKHAFVVKISTA